MPNKSILTYISLIFIIISILLSGCKRKYTPKPRGYFRIDLPDKKYTELPDSFPFKFKYPVYTQIKNDRSRFAEKYWINIEYPEINGKIHISYKAINDNLDQLIEDSRNLAYKHAIKADAINETVFENPLKNVYGILYEIEGNAASSVQFFVTDSTEHYLRGALYIGVEPNKDSLAPIINFIKSDIKVLMESFEWD